MASRWQGPLISVATLVGLALLFAVVELGLSLGGWETTPYPAQQVDHQRWSNGPCYELRDRGGRKILVPTRGENVDTISIPLARQANVPRIAIVGASSGESFEWGTGAIAEQAGCEVEILRCSVPGGDARQALARLDEAMRYDPDAAVLIFGHNAFRRNPPGEAALLANDLSARSRAFNALRDVVDSSPRGERPPPAEETALLLEGATELARAADIPLSVTTMSSNLLMPPVDERTRSNHVLEARLALASNRPEAARRALEEALRVGPNAYVSFLFGSLWLERGEYQRARVQLELARDSDPARHRASSLVNARIREAAVSGDLGLIDVEQEVAQLDRAGVSDWRLMEDHVHPRDAVRRLVGRELLKTLPLEEPCRRSLDALTIDDRVELGDYEGSFDLAAHQAAGGSVDLWGEALGRLAAAAVGELGDPAIEAMRRRFDNLDAELRAKLAAPFADGLLWAGAVGESIEVLESNPNPSSDRYHIQRGLGLLADSQSAQAIDALRRAGVSDPEALVAAAAAAGTGADGS